MNWWRAQAVRFLLRWPSSYLCHVLNFARHQAYGQAVAEAVLGIKGQGEEPEMGQGEGQELMKSLEAARSHCSGRNQLCAFSTGDTGPSFEEGSIDPLPFIFRPILGVHVRGSDKGAEMKLLPATTYFKAMERVRSNSRVPFRNVWLSSEEQVQIEIMQILTPLCFPVLH